MVTQHRLWDAVAGIFVKQKAWKVQVGVDSLAGPSLTRTHTCATLFDIKLWLTSGPTPGGQSAAGAAASSWRGRVVPRSGAQSFDHGTFVKKKNITGVNLPAVSCSHVQESLSFHKLDQNTATL